MATRKAIYAAKDANRPYRTSVVVYYQWLRMKNAYRNKLMKEVGEKNLAWIEVIHNITVTKQKEGIKKKPAVLIQFQM